jgi:hypothetical protein
MTLRRWPRMNGAPDGSLRHPVVLRVPAPLFAFQDLDRHLEIDKPYRRWLVLRVDLKAAAADGTFE